MTPPNQQRPAAAAATGGNAGQADAMFRLLDRPLTPADLEETTARVRQPITPPQRQLTRVLAFRLGDEVLAFSAGDVRRVTGRVPVHRVPHRTNKIIRGLCSIEGELLICTSLRDLLGLPPPEPATPDQPDDARRMVVLGEGQEGWVFEVDSVLGVAHVDRHGAKRPPVTVEHAHDCYTDSLLPVDGLQATLLNTKGVRAGFEAALS